LKPAEKDLTWALVVPKTVQDDEEFFTVRFRSLRLRLSHSLCKFRDPEFHL